MTDAQKEFRKTGIGASEAAAVLDKSEHEEPIDVYARKTEEALGKADAPWLEWGLRLQEPVLCWYESRVVCSPIERVISHTSRSSTYAHVLATPDALFQDRVVEAKAFSERRRKDFGPELTDEVPDDILIQVTVQMGVTGLKLADVPVLFGNEWAGIWRVKFNADLWGSIATKLEKFWKEHVEARVPPPVRGSEAYTEWLQHKYAVLAGRKVCAPATDVQAGLLKDWRVLHLAIKPLKQELDKVKNFVRNDLAGSYGFSVPGLGHVVSGGGDKQTEHTDWKTLAEHFRDQFSKMLDEQGADGAGERIWKEKLAEFTESKLSPRSLRAYFEEE